MSPDPAEITALLVEVRSGLATLQAAVSKLERSVQGDADTGTPSLRQAIKALGDEVNGVDEALCERLDKLDERIDKLERASAAQDNYIRGMTTVIKWAGGTSLAGLLALIGMLSGLLGGGAK